MRIDVDSIDGFFPIVPFTSDQCVMEEEREHSDLFHSIKFFSYLLSREDNDADDKKLSGILISKLFMNVLF